MRWCPWRAGGREAGDAKLKISPGPVALYEVFIRVAVILYDKFTSNAD